MAGCRKQDWRDGTWEDRGEWMGETLYEAIHAYQRGGERAGWEPTA
ncbi:MAG: hypothetical protein OXI05_08945 [Bacteroidota bacterium]|nr:hypothetical protein [Bacteroidota bacterium]MDE2645948.1 hypothetical protein [Bacteroidota bacterium]